MTVNRLPMGDDRTGNEERVPSVTVIPYRLSVIVNGYKNKRTPVSKGHVV
jgi:hypothetical protein